MKNIVSVLDAAAKRPWIPKRDQHNIDYDYTEYDYVWNIVTKCLNVK